MPGFGKTLAATWGGPIRGLTEFAALRECLIDFVWAKHMLTVPGCDDQMHLGLGQLFSVFPLTPVIISV